jgi:hypothetical protein
MCVCVFIETRLKRTHIEWCTKNSLNKGVQLPLHRPSQCPPSLSLSIESQCPPSLSLSIETFASKTPPPKKYVTAYLVSSSLIHTHKPHTHTKTTHTHTARTHTPPHTHEAQTHLAARPRVWAQPKPDPKPDPKPAAPIEDWIQWQCVCV